MNIYLRLVYRNLRANLDRASLFFELIFPLFFIFVQGFGLNGIVPPFEIGNGRVISYSLFLAAGAVTLTVINGAQMRGHNSGSTGRTACSNRSSWAPSQGPNTS